MAKKHCEHCGAPMVEYRHSMSKALGKCLIPLAEAGGGPINVYRDLQFTHSQMCNFRKMRYWGLIAHGDEENIRNGMWFLTYHGWRFVRGKVPVHKWVVTYRGNIVRFEGDKVFINDLTDGWRHREDYVADAMAHIE